MRGLLQGARFEDELEEGLAITRGERVEATASGDQTGRVEAQGFREGTEEPPTRACVGGGTTLRGAGLRDHPSTRAALQRPARGVRPPISSLGKARWTRFDRFPLETGSGQPLGAVGRDDVAQGFVDARVEPRGKLAAQLARRACDTREAANQDAIGIDQESALSDPSRETSSNVEGVSRHDPRQDLLGGADEEVQPGLGSPFMGLLGRTGRSTSGLASLPAPRKRRGGSQGRVRGGGNGAGVSQGADLSEEAGRFRADRGSPREVSESKEVGKTGRNGPPNTPRETRTRRKWTGIPGFSAGKGRGSAPDACRPLSPGTRTIRSLAYLDPAELAGAGTRACVGTELEAAHLLLIGGTNVSGMLEGRKGLILGVANKRSVAWSCAQALRREGMELALTYVGERFERPVKQLAEELEVETVLPCDVTHLEEIDALVDNLGQAFGQLDCIVHAIAFAKREELKGTYLDTSREGFQIAQNISAYSLPAVAKRAIPLMEGRDGSIMTLTYIGSERVIPNYNVMGVAKASLEASVRYLAHDLGPRGIRVNAISAGPIRTLSASGVEGFSEILDRIAERSPLKRNITSDEVADTCAFLASPMSRGITGSTIYVDAGYHIMGI